MTNKSNNVVMLSLFILTIFISILCVGLNTSNDLFTCSTMLVITLIFIIISLFHANKQSDMFQPITIINIILLFIFVLRPIQLLIATDIQSFNFFRYYSLVYGGNTLVDLPFDLALVLGTIGTASINTGYWCVRKKNRNSKITDKPYIISLNDKIRINFWINCFIAFALIIWAYFIYKSLGKASNSVFTTKDILWMYIFCVVVLLQQIIDRRFGTKIIAILILSIISFSLLGTRQHIVNLLLCTFIPYVYMRKKSINMRTLILGFLIVFVVLWYGSMRSGIDLTIGNSFERFLGEFSMYDALVLAIKHKETFGDPYYFGYNYLCFLNYIIPGINIEFFDYMHTRILFNGAIGGGTPTSLVGSLYLNYSYIGVILGCILFGVFVSKRYNKYARMRTNISLAYYSIFLTFVYDVLRVGDIGRELVNYLILLGCFKIAMIFVKKKESNKNTMELINEGK